MGSADRSGEKGDGHGIRVLLLVDSLTPLLMHTMILIHKTRQQTISLHSIRRILLLTNIRIRDYILRTKQSPPDIVNRAIFMLVDPQFLFSIITNTLIWLVVESIESTTDDAVELV